MMPLYRFVFADRAVEQPGKNLADAYNTLTQTLGAASVESWSSGKRLMTIECGVAKTSETFDLESEDLHFRVEADYAPYSPTTQVDPGNDADAWPHRVWYKSGTVYIEIPDFEKALTKSTLEWIKEKCREKYVG